MGFLPFSKSSFVCDRCGGTFPAGDDDVARAEYLERFGPNAPPIEECAVVCDDCYEELNQRAELSVCRVCGCTDDDCSACVARTGSPCFWVEDDLCSACAGSGVQG